MMHNGPMGPYGPPNMGGGMGSNMYGGPPVSSSAAGPNGGGPMFGPNGAPSGPSPGNGQMVGGPGGSMMCPPTSCAPMTSGNQIHSPMTPSSTQGGMTISTGP